MVAADPTIRSSFMWGEWTQTYGMLAALPCWALLGPAGVGALAKLHATQSTTCSRCMVLSDSMSCVQALMRGEWKQAYDTLAALPC